MIFPEDYPTYLGGLIAHGEYADGIYWVTAHAPMWGAANGYVRLPKDHPWLDLEPHEIDNSVPYGEITYAEGSWIGFDTLHAGQVWPESPMASFSYGSMPTIQMTHELVVSWTKQLAQDAHTALRMEGAEAVLQQWTEDLSIVEKRDKE